MANFKLTLFICSLSALFGAVWSLKCHCDMERGSVEPCINGYCTGNDNYMDVTEKGSFACVAVNISSKGVHYGCIRSKTFGRDDFCKTTVNKRIGETTICFCRAGDFCNRGLFGHAVLQQGSTFNENWRRDSQYRITTGKPWRARTTQTPSTVRYTPWTWPPTTRRTYRTRTRSPQTRLTTRTPYTTKPTTTEKSTTIKTTEKSVTKKLWIERSKLNEPIKEQPDTWSKIVDKQNSDTHRKSLFESAKEPEPTYDTSSGTLIVSGQIDVKSKQSNSDSYVVSGKTGQVIEKPKFGHVTTDKPPPPSMTLKPENDGKKGSWPKGSPSIRQNSLMTFLFCLVTSLVLKSL